MREMGRRSHRILFFADQLWWTFPRGVNRLLLMSESADLELLNKHFQSLTGSRAAAITPMRAHASERRMYRVQGANRRVIGVVNNNPPENNAFVYLAEHFRDFQLPVPEVFLFEAGECVYLEEDLGDTTLLDFLVEQRLESGESFPKNVEAIYRQVLEYLPRFQIEAAKTLDFSNCYPDAYFSVAALHGDMNAFKVELVSRIIPEWDSSKLESDFKKLASFLSEAQSDYFVHRDFQARNIMVRGSNPSFIDFQGGRRGPLQYDVASLLFQSSAQLTDEVRDALVEHYLVAASHHTSIDRSEFNRYYKCFVITRMLQVLGVYGRQGLGAGKEYFLKSIPGALATLANELSHKTLPIQLPRLLNCVGNLQSKLEKR